MIIYTSTDIETTGYKYGAYSNSDQILECACIRYNDNFDILNTADLFFYKPEFCVESSAQRIHHLQREFLEKFEDDFDKNLATMYSMLYNTILVGKNSKRFDIPFIHDFIYQHAPDLMEFEIYGSLDIQIALKDVFTEWAKSNCAADDRGSSLEKYMVMFGITKEEVDAEYSRLGFDKLLPGALHTASYDALVTYMIHRTSKMI